MTPREAVSLLVEAGLVAPDRAPAAMAVLSAGLAGSSAGQRPRLLGDQDEIVVRGTHRGTG